MHVALAVALGLFLAVLVFWGVSRRGARLSTSKVAARETTPAFDRFVREALERELASRVLGFANSTEQERAHLRRTLAGDPDPEVVGKIEELVRSVEIELVREGEGNVEATVRVRWESGRVSVRSERLALGDLPSSVRNELETKSARQVLRPWTFPWQSPADATG